MGQAIYADAVRKHLEDHEAGVIATVGPRGTLHQSVVRYVLDGDDICISTEQDRVKARHVQAGGAVSFCVCGAQPPYPAVTIHGRGSIQHTGIAELSRRVMRQMGIERDVDDASLAAKGRVIVRITPAKVLSAWI